MSGSQAAPTKPCAQCSWGSWNAATHTGSTVFATQYAKKDWHARLGGGVHADAIMDRIVHDAWWINTGDINMREHSAATQRSLD